MTRSILLSLVLAATLAPPLHAANETVYIPVPEIKGLGSSFSTVLVTNRSGGSLSLNVAFIPSGVSGATVPTGATVAFPGGTSRVFDTAPLVQGRSGLLRLTGPDLIDVTHSAQYVKVGSQNSAWMVPVLGPDNRFEAGRTVFLEEMARNAGGVSNVEIVNVSAVQARCRIEMRDALGTSILPSRQVTVPRRAHVVVRDIFGAAGVSEIEGGRARVTCDRRFWAYGTFVPTEYMLAFRYYYAMRTEPAPFDETQTVSVDRDGDFFTARPGSSKYDVTIPLRPGVRYRHSTVEFDVTIARFSTHFTALAGMFHAGGPRFNKTLYYGSFIRGLRRRTLLDLGRPTLEAAVLRHAAFQEGHTYHVRIVYDTDHNTVLWEATENGQVVLSALGGIFNTELVDAGAPITLSLGLGGVADNAYFPPIDWQFRDLRVRFRR